MLTVIIIIIIIIDLVTKTLTKLETKTFSYIVFEIKTDIIFKIVRKKIQYNTIQ